jgi:hypothetical protein
MNARSYFRADARFRFLEYSRASPRALLRFDGLTRGPDLDPLLSGGFSCGEKSIWGNYALARPGLRISHDSKYARLSAFGYTVLLHEQRTSSIILQRLQTYRGVHSSI